MHTGNLNIPYYIAKLELKSIKLSHCCNTEIISVTLTIFRIFTDNYFQYRDGIGKTGLSQPGQEFISSVDQFNHSVQNRSANSTVAEL